VLGLAVKASSRHPVTQWLHGNACIGDRVEISGGQGLFIFQAEMAPRIVLVGAGVGVTPLVSIFRYVADAAPDIQATLVYSIPTPEEFLFRNELETLVRAHPNLRMLVTATQAREPHWSGRKGRIHAELLATAGDTPDTLYYLCGPQGMVEDVCALLAALHVSQERIVFEKWW
jgi:ferredoxin-NADP reductase